ncbi:MAG: hypothetical protein AB7K68_10765 [Bacteriovoracia bacterium]
MIRCLLLCFLFSAPVFAGTDDIEKDLLDLQQSVEGVLHKFNTSSRGTPASQLDVARRKVFALAEDKQFLKAMNELWANPHRNQLLIVQGIFFAVVFLLKAWRQAKAANWFTRIFVGLFFSFITWGGLLYVIPAVVLGEPYRIFVGTIWRVLVSS